MKTLDIIIVVLFLLFIGAVIGHIPLISFIIGTMGFLIAGVVLVVIFVRILLRRKN